MRTRIPALLGGFVIAVTCFVLADDKSELSPVMLVEYQRNDVAAADVVVTLFKANGKAAPLVNELKLGNEQLALFVPILTAEPAHILTLIEKANLQQQVVLLAKFKRVKDTKEGVSELMAVNSDAFTLIGFIEFENGINSLIDFRNALWVRLHPGRKPLERITFHLPPGGGPGPKVPDAPTATSVLQLLQQNVKLFDVLLNELNRIAFELYVKNENTFIDLENSLEAYLDALIEEKAKLEGMLPPPGTQIPVDPALLLKLSLLATVTIAIENQESDARLAALAAKADVDTILNLITSVETAILDSDNDIEMLKKLKK